MNLKSLSRSLFSLVLLISVGSPAGLRAEGDGVTLFPIGEPYGGGFSSWGGTEVKADKETALLTVRNARNLGFARWFLTHRPLPSTTVQEWIGGEIRVEIKATEAPRDAVLSACWRGTVNPPELGAVSKEKVKIETEWSTVVIPVPGVEGVASASLTGILVRIDPGGEYQIKKIEVVPPKGTATPAAAATTPAATATATPAAAANPVVTGTLVGSSQQKADEAAQRPGKDGNPDRMFLQMHSYHVGRAKKGNIDCVFFGDSITLGWNAHKEILAKHFGTPAPVIFGVGNDWTQHLLWRLENGELDGYTPKVAVVMIGTNNANGHPAAETAKGVTKIVETIRTKSPTTKVLLLGLFPRSPKPNSYRAKNEAVNAIISKLHDGQHVFYSDISSKFVAADGSISKEVMPDALHLSAQGYEIWGEAIAQQVAELRK